ncbi:MAG: CDP-glycerol glycerophosphotransferase family protein [Lachnospiraceae bacterium]|nr:CDP-glycerol glycerophosphotransferase family protein [bacterium]MDY5518187.1 CDP-glycerol glycerophosphotransferase family protein [Lachnospiraceae bacterium]
MSPKKMLKKLARFASLKVILPAVYAIAARKPVEPERVVFLEISADRLTDSFALLYEAVRERGRQSELICIHDGSVGGVQYLKNCANMLRSIATAPVVFINEASNVTSCVHLRPQTKLIQTWHGCGAFKKFGFSTASLEWGISGKEMERYPYYKNQWLVSVSAPEAVWAYQDAMHQPQGVIRPLGVSRTDVFFDPDYICKAREALYQYFPQARGKKVILYAPTFRGTQTHAGTLQLDHEAFRLALSDRYVLVEKHHPFVKHLPQIPENCRDFAVDLTGAMSISQLLCVSDICISDYSSLVFEYSLFERPMIFYAPDLEEYFDARGFYYDYDALTPGPVYKEQSGMITYIQEIGTRFDRQQVAAFREKFMSACDGHATERILDAIGI